MLKGSLRVECLDGNPAHARIFVDTEDGQSVELQSVLRVNISLSSGGHYHADLKVADLRVNVRLPDGATTVEVAEGRETNGL